MTRLVSPELFVFPPADSCPYYIEMRTTAIKVNVKMETACFNIYFSLREIYNNNKTESENTMILRMQ